MAPKAGFLLGKCSTDRRNSTISRTEDQKILNVLKGMDKDERDKTQIAIIVRPERKYRKFLLYPDGRYQDMTGKQIYSLKADIQVLRLAG